MRASSEADMRGVLCSYRMGVSDFRLDIFSNSCLNVYPIPSQVAMYPGIQVGGYQCTIVPSSSKKQHHVWALSAANRRGLEIVGRTSCIFLAGG